MPNSRIVATGGLDETIRLWDLGQPKPSASPIELKGNAGEVSALAASPDGRLLAAGYTKTIKYNDFSFRPPQIVRTIYVWDLRNTQKPRIILGTHDGEITSLQFRFDSRFLASGSEDRTARVWDLSRPGVTPLILRGHDQTVKAVAFRHDGRALVTGSYDGTTRLWDLERPEDAPLIWNSNNGEVISVAFSPDGRSVASGYMNGRILVWAADPAFVAAVACRKLRRNMTVPEWRQFVGAGVHYEKTCEELPPGT